MKQTIIRLLCTCTVLTCLLGNPAFAAKPPKGPFVGIMEEPIYVTLAKDGWVGLYARGRQYVEYSLPPGLDAKDATHILLPPGVGLELTFADRRQFGAGSDMLDAHKNWEIDYQRQHAAKVESRNRDDLADGRSDVRVTELTIVHDGKPRTGYLIGVPMNDGVFVFSIWQASPDIDPMVRKLIASIRVVNEYLDIDAEGRRLIAESNRKH